ncbi:MAG TPA: nucleoside triphosphate pyrophosphohydrolase [Chthoniobacterales bacterium]
MSAKKRPAKFPNSALTDRSGEFNADEVEDRPSIGGQFERLCEIVARLRAPGGCSWDREQTNESLLPGLIEEAYEVAAAVRAGDDQNLREELGDLILLAVMHSEIAAEHGRFQIEQVLSDVTEKLIRRHPHVFGESDARDADAVIKQWDAIKAEEKNAPDAHYLADLPSALPALMRAQKAQSKVARVNFDWTEISNVVAKVEEELDETKEAIGSGDREAIADEIGDLLFAAVNLARKNKLDAEAALQRATDKFVSRFNRVEDELRARGKKLGHATLKELDEIWKALKREDRTGPSD